MKACFSLLLLLTYFSLPAQKVDLDRFHFTAQYRNFPNVQLDKEYVTYNLSFGGSPITKAFMMEDDLDRSINLYGWKKLRRDGHITVKTIFGDFIIKSSTVAERKEDIKDKDGKITGTRTYYSSRIVYNFPTSYMVVDYKGATLANEQIGNGDKTWSSDEYNNYKEAADYYNNNRNVIRGNLCRKDMVQDLATIASRVNFKFGYPPANNLLKLWILNNKKHPEYEATQAQWNSFKAVAARTTYEGVSEEDKKTLLSVVAYFDGLKTKYNGGDKTDKKMRYSCFYNNAMIYTWFLDNFDAAIKEADGLIANDFDSGDGKDLKKDAEKMAEALRKNNVNSLHYAINLDDARGPKQ